MRASLLAQTLKSFIQIGRPVCIEGAPGGGKTSIVHQVARDLNLPLIERHMPTMLVEDFGIPYPDEVTFGYKMPEWFPYQGREGTENGGILLFDDRNQAGADLQKVLANIMQARTLHGMPLAEGWSVVSTGNRQQDRAGANRVLSHLADRETTVEFETNLEDSTDWMARHNVPVEVIAFLNFRPALLHDFDPNRDKNSTPRGWVEGVGRVLHHIPVGAEHEVIKGAVGEGAASEFTGFLKVWRSLPDVDGILRNPESHDVPSDPATLYALAGSIAAKMTPKNIANAVTYLGRMPKEFSVLAMQTATKGGDERALELVNTEAFIQWGIANEDVLMGR